MIWDPCLARAVAAELADRLEGARARAIVLRREALEVAIHFRQATLLADLSPARGVVVMRPPSEPDPLAEPLPAVLTRVETVRDERVILLRFRRVRGRKPHPTLILELATNRWNAVWAEGAALRVRKRLKGAKSQTRIGQAWTPPGANADARRTDELDEGAWARLLEGLDAGEARKALLGGVAYTSGLNAGFLLEAPTPAEGFRRWRRMSALADLAPHMLETKSGHQPYPWRLPGATARPVASLLEGMDQVLGASPGASSGASRGASPGASRSEAGGTRTDVTRLLTRERRRVRRKLKRLRQQLERTARADRMRDDASLILASLHLIDPGATEVELVGFDGTPRTIGLNPARRPQEHANALFRRASRLERGAVTLRDRIREAEAELARIEDLRKREQEGDLTPEEIAAFTPAPPARSARRAATDARPGSTTARPASATRPASAALPYRSYTSSGGLEIRVGRGARRNDDLTFHHSRPADVWLHARHGAGAHVILRWTNPDRPPAADLQEAAALAANHSRARASATVAVDWTRRKWVRKPRGAAPGAVVPDRVQTVFVSPDPALTERLRKT